MASPPPNNMLANTPAGQRFLGYDALETYQYSFTYLVA